MGRTVEVGSGATLGVLVCDVELQGREPTEDEQMRFADIISAAFAEMVKTDARLAGFNGCETEVLCGRGIRHKDLASALSRDHVWRFAMRIRGEQVQ